MAPVGRYLEDSLVPFNLPRVDDSDNGTILGQKEFRSKYIGDSLKVNSTFHGATLRFPILLLSGLLKRHILQPFEACGFFHPNRGNHLQGNVQVYNVRIPVKF